MAINVSGKRGGVRGDINVTPLVDVVLVLLIIFMVVTPLAQMGYGVQVPPRADDPAGTPQIIVRIDAGGRTYINQRAVPLGEFPARLGEALTGRASKVIFFAADGELTYDKVADFMDLCVDAGADNLGIVFEDLQGTT